MRETLESGIPDTAPYKEWLGLVGSMVVGSDLCSPIRRRCPDLRKDVRLSRPQNLRRSLAQFLSESGLT
jgi:hypothetical protein